MKLFNIHFRVGHLLGIGAFLFLAVKYLLSVKEMYATQGFLFTFLLGDFIACCLVLWIWMAYKYHQRAK